MFVFRVPTLGMKIATLLGCALLSTTTGEAAGKVTITCGAPARETEWLNVPIRITNRSKEPVSFRNNFGAPTFQEFVTRRNTTHRWKNITLSMKGMCGVGLQPGPAVTLAPGESFDASTLVRQEHVGRLYRIALHLSKSASIDDPKVKIYSAPILLR